MFRIGLEQELTELTEVLQTRSAIFRTIGIKRRGERGFRVASGWFTVHCKSWRSKLPELPLITAYYRFCEGGREKKLQAPSVQHPNSNPALWEMKSARQGLKFEVGDPTSPYPSSLPFADERAGEGSSKSDSKADGGRFGAVWRGLADAKKAVKSVSVGFGRFIQMRNSECGVWNQCEVRMVDG